MLPLLGCIKHPDIPNENGVRAKAFSAKLSQIRLQLMALITSSAFSRLRRYYYNTLRGPASGISLEVSVISFKYYAPSFTSMLVMYCTVQTV